MKTSTLYPQVWIDLGDELQGKHFVSASLDYDKRLFVLTSLSELDYRIVEPDSYSFPRFKTRTPHDYVVYEATEHYSTSYSILKQHWNYHQVQPLPDDELLLVSSRSRYRGIDDFDLNGCVFTNDGVFVREFLLGDGIESVQATRSGSIWTSYFDEGIIGNYGWKKPIGSSGLIEWDKNGGKKYSYQPAAGLGYMTCCYALNVVSDHETWLYYYTKFPLVRLIDGRMDRFWQPPITGAHHFAVWSNYVLFYGGYDNDQFHLFRLESKEQMTKLATYSLELKPYYVLSRGNRIVLMKDNIFYQIDLADLVRSL